MVASVKLVNTGRMLPNGWRKYYVVYRNVPGEIRNHFIWLPPGANRELIEDIFKDLINLSEESEDTSHA